MTQQTAVEFLEAIIKHCQRFGTNVEQKDIKQAKAMEKQQIIDAFDEGQEYEYQYHINNTPKFDSITYYAETYGSKEGDDHIVDTNIMVYSETEISDEQAIEMVKDMNKQSSIEWLIKKLEEEELIFNHGLVERWKEQAKAMEKIKEQMRRDFWGTYECEFCNHIEKNVSGYDDNNFHVNVTLEMKCKSCGESTLSKGGDVQQVHTKYPQGYQI